MSDTQQSPATLSCNFVAQQSMTSRVAQLLAIQATKLLDEKLETISFFCNFSLCCRAVIGQLFVYVLKFLWHFLTFTWCLWWSDEAINKALIVPSSESIETMFVQWQLFTNEKLTVA